MPATATIRVTPDTRERLNRIGAQRGVSAGEVVEELATLAEGSDLLAATERHYVQLSEDPQAWAAHQTEVAAWDITAGDGLVTGLHI